MEDSQACLQLIKIWSKSNLDADDHREFIKLQSLIIDDQYKMHALKYSMAHIICNQLLSNLAEIADTVVKDAFPSGCTGWRKIQSYLDRNSTVTRKDALINLFKLIPPKSLLYINFDACDTFLVPNNIHRCNRSVLANFAEYHKLEYKKIDNFGRDCTNEDRLILLDSVFVNE